MGTKRRAPKTPARVRMTRHAREQQLLDVAERLFTNRGFDATSIEDLARAARVTRPVLYQHFRDKDAILVACVRRAREELERSIAAAVVAAPKNDVASLVEAGGNVFFALLEANPKRWALLFSTTTAPSSHLAQRLSELRYKTVSLIVEIARKTQPDVDEQTVRALAHSMSGVSEQLGRWWMDQEGLTRDRLLAYYKSFVVGGIDELLAASRRKKRRARR